MLTEQGRREISTKDLLSHFVIFQQAKGQVSCEAAITLLSFPTYHCVAVATKENLLKTF